MPPTLVVGMGSMMFRVILSCAALIVGLLAALNVTAQSAGACNGTACNSSGKAQPLNLMGFMNGTGKVGAARPTATAAAPARTASTRHRHTAKTAARSRNDALNPLEPPVLPSAAASAYAEHSERDVQVVSGDEVNAIDLAMNNANAETNGTAPRSESDNRDRVKWADAKEFGADQFKPRAPVAPASEPPAGRTVRDDSWMGRFWAAVGDGFIALVALVKQLFS